MAIIKYGVSIFIFIVSILCSYGFGFNSGVRNAFLFEAQNDAIFTFHSITYLKKNEKQKLIGMLQNALDENIAVIEDLRAKKKVIFSFPRFLQYNDMFTFNSSEKLEKLLKNLNEQ